MKADKGRKKMENKNKKMVERKKKRRKNQPMASRELLPERLPLSHNDDAKIWRFLSNFVLSYCFSESCTVQHTLGTTLILVQHYLNVLLTN